MSWEDLITHVLATSSKVDKLVVYDVMGRPVACTEDVQTCYEEGLALVNCLRDPAKTTTKLHISDEMFICVQGIDLTFVGTSCRDPSLVVVAHQVSHQGMPEDDGHVVVVIGQSAGRGSFIFELKQCLAMKAQGQLITQQHLQQTKILLPVDVALTSQDDLDLDRSGAVLVDLMS